MSRIGFLHSCVDVCAVGTTEHCRNRKYISLPVEKYTSQSLHCFSDYAGQPNLKILTSQKQLSAAIRSGPHVLDGRVAAAEQTAPTDAVAAKGLPRAGDGWSVLVHQEQRWAFDANQVVRWSAEDQAFRFYAFHGLSAPSVESVAEFIDFMGFLNLVRIA